VADEPINLVLEHLKRFQASMDAMRLDLLDLKVRMSAVGTHIGQLTMQVGAVNGRLDRFDERLSRIERRLDLIEA
jgi:predicted  nucleic acid-binding Zn-ribbon protein